ncbi:hypothetical protein O181_081848 [Austropuccinia psidii MF-1]|uniref:Ribosomal protein S2 n=1 Tax=Austropuccinia psidii MF-1 TaxID=1389203 RepID=A0A9Q3FLD3_9BASI|nr:hypothetical protein [Austropuccinia psidii MF-1]
MITISSLNILKLHHHPMLSITYSSLIISQIRKTSTFTNSTSSSTSSSFESPLTLISQTHPSTLDRQSQISQTSNQKRIHALIQKMQETAKKTIQHRQNLANDRDKLSQIGSIQTTLKTSKPSHLPNNPPQPTDLTLAALISTASHLGHNKSLTCPTNYPLIYGFRSDLAIIDLRQTLSYLRRACNVVRKTVENDGIVLFTNGVPGSEKAIQLASQRLGKNGYSLGLRPNGQGANWVRGTLTNAPEVLKRPRQAAKQNRLSEENSRLESESSYRKQSENQETSKFLPSLILVFNPRQSKVLLREAALKQIPTIGVIDTDVDPRIVTYPIPANDDSARSIELIAGVLSKAGQEGLRKRTEMMNSLQKIF